MKVLSKCPCYAHFRPAQRVRSERNRSQVSTIKCRHFMCVRSAHGCHARVMADSGSRLSALAPSLRLCHRRLSGAPPACRCAQAAHAAQTPLRHALYLRSNLRDEGFDKQTSVRIQPQSTLRSCVRYNCSQMGISESRRRGQVQARVPCTRSIHLGYRSGGLEHSLDPP